MTQDMTQGKIMPMLVHFTIPLVLGNLFQLTYNAVDSIIVGHFVGKEALAAVGICNPITTLFISPPMQSPPTGKSCATSAAACAWRWRALPCLPMHRCWARTLPAC